MSRLDNFLFNVFGSVAALSGLGMLGSIALETLSGKNYSVAGTELTVKFSDLDRVLLVVLLLSLMLTGYFWSRLRHK